MDNLNKLDFDVSYDTSFSSEDANLIDVYARDVEVTTAQKEEDKLISFSAIIYSFKKLSFSCCVGYPNTIKHSSHTYLIEGDVESTFFRTAFTDFL